LSAELSSHRLARFAGGAYLLQMTAGVFAQLYARGSLLVGGDPAATAANIRASELLYRTGVAADLVCYVAVLLATWALYVLLRPVDRRLAALALFLRTIELAVHFSAVALSLVALRLLHGGPALAAFTLEQRDAAAYFAIAAQGTSVGLGFIPLGLGSAAFAILLLRSRAVPRWLAWLGIVGCALLVGQQLGAIVTPVLGRLRYLPMLPMGAYEVALGFYLLLHGLRVSAHHADQERATS
jgi:hypothetical protein